MANKFVEHLYEIAVDLLKQSPLPYGLREYQDVALNEFFVGLCNEDKIKNKLDKVNKEGQRKYIYVCIRHEAERQRRDGNQLKALPLPPLSVLEPDDDSITNLIFPRLNHEERLLFVLLSWEYYQIQIAEILDISITKAHRIVKSLREKIKNILKGEFQMSVYSDKEIYGFIDKKSGAKKLGNENFRRDIKRSLKPIRESLAPLIGATGGNPPIPPGMSKIISDTINRHAKPPVIAEVLTTLKPADPLLLCSDLLEASRQLNKPYRWVTPEESLRAIENPVHAKKQIGCLCQLLAKTLLIFTAKRERKGKQQITKILCLELVSLADRFKSQRGTGCNPFIILSDKTEPLHPSAIKMEKEIENSFDVSLKKLEHVCKEKSSDTDTTFKDLQALVDWHVRLLDWQIFDAPRYLGPAIMEEAIEVMRAFNLDGKKNLFQETAQLLYMTLWLSNVLAIPDLGYLLMESEA